MELLERIAQTAASRPRAFLIAASPEFFNLESYAQLDAPRDFSKVFDTTEYAKWKSFRASEDSRYVGLTCPRVLGRLPYGKDTKSVERSTTKRTWTAPTTRSICGAMRRTRLAPA